MSFNLLLIIRPFLDLDDSRELLRLRPEDLLLPDEFELPLELLRLLSESLKHFLSQFLLHRLNHIYVLGKSSAFASFKVSASPVTAIGALPSPGGNRVAPGAI